MSTETFLEHIWVNIPQRTVKILDDEGYDEVINWKFDEEGAVGFVETVSELPEILDNDMITYCFAVQ